MTHARPAARATKFDSVAGAAIKTIRKDAGLSQEELGAEVGVTFQQIQKYENGTNRLSVERFARIAVALKQNPAKLFTSIHNAARRARK